jgi:eukaryotic-like serine/threonine-protein kinase
MSPSLSPPTVGAVLGGKYRLDTLIGAGGMGSVYGATDLSLGRQVALKLLSPASAAQRDDLLRFAREARAVAAIESDHVVRVFEVGVGPAHPAPFIVMEWLRGSDLAGLLRKQGPMPVPVAVDYLLEACAGLAEAHRAGIVHRDLKPHNLFLAERSDGTSVVKVLDFGISKFEEPGAAPLTHTGTTLGSPLYMSPEQIRSFKHVGPAADIWALGTILFELLTAQAQWLAPTAGAVCAAILTNAARPACTARPDVPAALDAVIARCLAKEARDRFASVGALAGALVPFASQRGRMAAERLIAVEVRSASLAPMAPVNAFAPTQVSVLPGPPGGARVPGFVLGHVHIVLLVVAVLAMLGVGAVVAAVRVGIDRIEETATPKDEAPDDEPVRGKKSKKVPASRAGPGDGDNSEAPDPPKPEEATGAQH